MSRETGAQRHAGWTRRHTTIMLRSVLPAFTEAGLLPPGMHRASWEEVCARFGGTRKRGRLLDGLLQAATNLRDAGAVNLWLDGSFTTNKPNPDDFDGVWDPSRVDLRKVDPVLIDSQDLATGRYKQKAKYGGELLISGDRVSGMAFQQFFQFTENGETKGIVLLDLRTLP